MSKIKTRRVNSRKTRLLTLVLFGFVGIITALSSCNVTRKVTTESSYFQKGDTSCTITVKTVESYDATKKLQ